MKTIDFSYFIERYIAGEMNAEEKIWFLKELEGNESLRSEVKLREHTDIVLKSQNVISLRTKLSGIEKNRLLNAPVKNSKNTGYYKYAAIIAVLVIIGGITLFTGKNLSNEEIISRSNTVYEPLTTQRTGQAEINTDFSLGIEFYNTHDFKNAANLFNKVLKSNPGDLQSELLLGISNFEQSKYQEAEKSFTKIINDNNNLFIETAEWYLALNYIKTNEIKSAVKQLEMIKKDAGFYSVEAKKILRKLH